MTKSNLDNLQQVRLKLEQSKTRLEKVKAQLNNIEVPNYSTTENKGVNNQSLTTIGRIEKIIIEEKILHLQGWVASLESTNLEGFKLSIAGREIPELKLELGLPSPDIKKAYPYLEQGDRCRFSIQIALDSEFQNLSDSLLILTPLFPGGSGSILVDAIKPSLPLPSPEYLKWRGGGGEGGRFEKASFGFLSHFIQKGGLQPTDRVLDVGCGLGRMAYSLTFYLKPPGYYEGFDIIARHLQWPQEVITPRFPHFNFRLVNIYNKRYNPSGNLNGVDFEFPYPNENFDFVFLTSVFTHLQGQEVRHYLDEIKRVLSPGGRCLLTCFLLNSESEMLIAQGKSSQNLIYKLEDCFTKDKEVPERATGFKEPLILQWLSERNLSVLGTYYGSWCGRDKSSYGQDFLVVQKLG